MNELFKGGQGRTSQEVADTCQAIVILGVVFIFSASALVFANLMGWWQP